MNWIEIFTIIPVLYNLIKQAVQDVESDMPGAQKKEAVMAVIKAAVDGMAAVGLKVPATVVLTIASALIDGVVTLFNIVGIFKKKPVPAA
jgi:hypothetical protein